MKRWTLIAVLFTGWCACKAWDAITAPFTTGDRTAAWGWLALAATFAWYVAYGYPHGGAA